MTNNALFIPEIENVHKRSDVNCNIHFPFAKYHLLSKTMCFFFFVNQATSCVFFFFGESSDTMCLNLLKPEITIVANPEPCGHLLKFRCIAQCKISNLLLTEPSFNLLNHLLKAPINSPILFDLGFLDIQTFNFDKGIQNCLVGSYIKNLRHLDLDNTFCTIETMKPNLVKYHEQC